MRAKCRFIFLVLGASASCSLAQAQVVTDGSLGARTSIAGPNYFVNAALGQQRGVNLFHSFGIFNVGTGQSAFFDSGTGVTNIIARVTGGSVTTINGALIANSNLFLVNPQGIVFGSTATINVAGSFHASTADYVRLSDGARFYASLGGSSLLTAADPAAFGFLDNTVAPISASGATFASASSQSLSFIGGDITLTNSRLSAPRGRINFASVASPGEVVLTPVALSATGFGAKGTVRLNNSLINEAGEEAAQLYIRGGQFVMENNSGILGLTSASTGARVIDIDVDTFQLKNSLIDYEPNAGVSGGPVTTASIRAKQFSVSDSSAILVAGGGDFTIIADDFRVTNVALVGTGTAFGAGTAGNLSIQANTVTVDYGALTALSAGDGNAGGVNVKADSVNLRNGGGIISTASGTGTGGQIAIEARQLIIDGSQTTRKTGITADSLGTPSNAGAAGTISINVDSLLVRNGFVSSSTNGPGRGGDVSIAAHSISIDQAGSVTTETGVVGSQGVPASFGAGGAIKIDTTSMQLLSGGHVSASTYANGLGGTVTVNAAQLVVDSTGNALSAGITANTGSNAIATASGAGGNLFLHVDDLQLRNQGQIGSNAFGSGQAGRIEISGSKMSITGGAVVSASSFGQAANAGGANDIVIQAGDLNVADFGEISNSTTGTGAAGRLLIASKNLNISNGGLLQASSLNSGTKAGAVGDIFISSDVVAMRAGSIDARSFGGAAPGAIVINARTATLDDGAVITATSAGSGNAGSISIGVADMLTLSHSSRITTEALRGSGGNIQAFAGGTLMLSDSAISTSVLGAAANGGNISIDPIFVILNRSQIIARAVGGSGGNINLATQYLVKSADSAIDASSQLGISGHVEIFGADVNLNADIAALPTDFLNAKRWLAKSCASRLGGDVSQFTVNGRDGVYRSPFDLSASQTAFDSSSTGSIPSVSVSGFNVPRMSFSPECLQGPG